MAYDLYPAVDEDLKLAPEVRAANAATPEFRNQVIPMTQTQRNNLSGAELWEGRLVMNTTTQRIDRYDDASDSWVTVTTEPAGCVKAWLTATPPEYHALLDGSSVSRTGIYAGLFAKWGTTFNTGGEASDHFRLPNMKGKTLIGVDSGQPEFNVIGETGGEKEHTLTTAEMPSHNHGGATPAGGGVDHLHSNSINGVGDHAHSIAMSDGPAVLNSGGTLIRKGGTGSESTGGAGAHNHSINNGAADRSLDHAHSITAQGGGAAHNNLPPYMAVHWIVTL